MDFKNVNSEDELMESLGKTSELSASELDNVSGGFCKTAGICLFVGNSKPQDSDNEK